jgi:hypothetical protein
MLDTVQVPFRKRTVGFFKNGLMTSNSCLKRFLNLRNYLHPDSGNNRQMIMNQNVYEFFFSFLDMSVGARDAFTEKKPEKKNLVTLSL